MDMELERTYIHGEGGMNLTERYAGPSALRIANLVPHPVRFGQGWFWTRAVCHGGESDELAFRQRPDGNGIDARCPTGHCSPEVAADALSAQIGWPIRSACEHPGQPVDRLWWLREWPPWRIAWWAAAALSFSAPLLLGHGAEAAILSFIGFGAGSWLTERSLTRRRGGRFRR